MSFRFNFQLGEYLDKSLFSCEDEQVSDRSDACNLKTCDFFPLVERDLKRINEDFSLLKIGDLEVKYILINSLERKTENEVISEINTSQTDLIPGKYEGGLKIWECSIDLANYVAAKSCVKAGDRVLELGCGAGLPGVVAYMHGASVTFQDFNSEVLKYSTLPNVILNSSDERLQKIPEVCHFLYGDWKTIHEKFYYDLSIGEKYDVILTSETIYEKSNQKKLLELMKSALKPEGTIYLAAKIHYFGVGGGIVDFEVLLNSDKSFEIVSVHRITEGVERQILVIKFKKS